MGDALAVALLKHRGFTEADFARSHPGGASAAGSSLHVSDVMRAATTCRMVRPETPLTEGSRDVAQAPRPHGRRGRGRQVVGIFTDGDLRRALDRRVGHPREHDGRRHDARSRAIGPNELAAEAVLMMEKHSVNGLLVLDEAGRLVGALNVHDLLRAGVMVTPAGDAPPDRARARRGRRADRRHDPARSGEELKGFHVRDGLGIVAPHGRGIEVAVIRGALAALWPGAWPELGCTTSFRAWKTSHCPRAPALEFGSRAARGRRRRRRPSGSADRCARWPRDRGRRHAERQAKAAAHLVTETAAGVARPARLRIASARRAFTPFERTRDPGEHLLTIVRPSIAAVTWFVLHGRRHAEVDDTDHRIAADSGTTCSMQGRRP